jgi:hypothetical protein
VLNRRFIMIAFCCGGPFGVQAAALHGDQMTLESDLVGGDSRPSICRANAQ